MRTVSIAAVFVVVTLIGLLTRGSPAYAQNPPSVDQAERIATFAKPAVTRIFAGCRGTYVWIKGGANRQYRRTYYDTQSAFFINPNGYLLTSADAVELVKNLNTTCKDLMFEYSYLPALARDYNINLNSLSNTEYNNVYRDASQNTRLYNFEAINFVRLPSGKDLPFEIKSFGAAAGEGKNVAVVKVETKNAPVLKLGDSDKVRLQEHLTVAGYPWAADTDYSGILSDQSALEASFTDGRVSARKSAADGSPIIQISAPVTAGNSGGPVLNDNGEVIGIYAFQGDRVNRQNVQGFGFAIAANTAMEFIRQAGTTNEEGPTDAAYREGLELYWKGKYTAAIAKFEEVKRLFPQHSEMDRLIQDAQERKVKFGDAVDPAPVPSKANTGSSVARTVAIGVLALLGLGAVGVAVYVVQQNRRRPAMTYAASPGLPELDTGRHPGPWPSASTSSGPPNGSGYRVAGGYPQPEPATYREIQDPAYPPAQPARPVPPTAQGSTSRDIPSTQRLVRGGVCAQCGASLRPGAQFCSGCGARTAQV